METNNFLQLLYSTYNFRGVGSLYDKAKEVLLSIADGEPILDLSTLEIDTTFSKITPKQASTILRELTRKTILEFLNTREGYVRQIKPSKRIHRWLNTSNRLIKWQVDLIDLRWLNLHDYKYAITIIDVFSKYAFMIPIPNKQGVTVAKKLDILFSLPPFHGVTSKPKLLLSDRGSEFIDRIVRKVCKYHDVFQIFSLPYHPLGN